MLSWKATVSALEQPVAKLVKRSRWPLRVMVIAFTGLVLIYISLLVQAYQSLLQAWQFDSWEIYWSSVGPVFVALPLARLLEVQGHLAKSRRYRASILSARQAAIAGDDTLAPPATPPDSPISEELHISPDQMLRLHRPEDGRQLTYLWLGILLLVFGGVLGLIPAFVVATTWQKPGTLLVVAIVGGIAALFLIPGLILLTLSRRKRLVHLQIDGAGLRWRQGRRKRRASWHEFQAFTTVHYQRKNYATSRHDVFLLDASATVVAWELSEKSTEAERSAHRCLCEQVTSHTSLRLRDLTESIEKLQRDAQAARASARSDTVKSRAASVPAIPGMPPEPANPHLSTSRPTRKLSLGCVGLLVLLLPALLLYPLGWAAQRYEPGFLSTLVTRVHAEQPLYQDTLAADDGEWCLQTPTKKDPEYYGYLGSAYEMGGGASSDYMDCWRTTTYANYAVEVTTQQVGHDPQNDGVGMEMRLSQNRMQVFMVDQEGYWYLWDYHDVSSSGDLNWTNVDQGYNAAIQQGDGAINRLLAIVDDHQFILYVNNVYLATETVSDAQSSGFVGVLSYDAALPTSFTNFTVYPLPSLALPLPWGS